MEQHAAERRDAWLGIAIFIAVLSCLSGIAHLAIVKLNPASIYVGALMWCPTIAAFVALKIRGRGLESLPWQWGKWSYNWQGYWVPVLYVTLAYLLVWAFGFGGVPNGETVTEWSADLGLAPESAWLAILLMTALLATVQLAKSLGSIVGEEIGWRGFFIWELRKVLPFEGVALASGLVWAAWHFPIIIAYGGGNVAFQLGCFTMMIVSMSVIMTYYTFLSKSIWPAVLFHAAHNIYIQKIFTPLTNHNDSSIYWIDEYGLMIPISVTCLALYYWRKAKADGL